MFSPRLFATLLSLGLAAASAARADDTAPPEITHTPLEKSEKGKPVHIRAKITDESKFFPQVFFRWDGAAFGKPVDMKKVTAKKAPKDQYQATIPGKGDSLEYYIEAYDEFGNGPARAGAPEAPFKVEMTEPAVAEAPATRPDAKADDAPAVAETPRTDEPPAAVAAPTPRTEEPPAAAQPTRTAPRGATTTTAVAGGSPSRTWTWVVGGTGAGLLVGGLLTGMGVKKADDAYAARLKDPQVNVPTLQQQYDANKSLGTTATIMTIGGVVLLGAGTALYFYEPKWFGGDKRADNDREDGKVRFAAAPTDGGAAAVVAGKF